MFASFMLTVALAALHGAGLWSERRETGRWRGNGAAVTHEGPRGPGVGRRRRLRHKETVRWPTQRRGRAGR
jgi:hypothetical protein